MDNFPLSHLAKFGISLDHDAADRVADACRQHTNVS
jgi:hypothetical protein